MKLFEDKDSFEIIQIIFPQFKNLRIFEKLNFYAKKNFVDIDFIFLLSLIIIDGTDNIDYFLYKYNISKKDQKRMKIIDYFYSGKINKKSFTEKNLNKFLYFNGKEAVIDVINFRVFSSKKNEKELIELIEIYKKKTIPLFPIRANVLMSEYKIPEGKVLGNKLKMIEEIWIKNNFKISEDQIKKIVGN